MKHEQQNSYSAPRKNGKTGGGPGGKGASRLFDGAPRPNLADPGTGAACPEGRITPELLGLLCILGAALLFISLLSYSPADPSLNHVVRGNVPVNNWAGRFGSYLSAFLTDFFGFAAFVPFLFFAVLGVRLCVRAPAWAGWRWAGFVLLLACAAAAAAFWNAGLGQIRGGGLLGLLLRDFSLRYFNPIGSGFIWCFIFLLMLQMLFGFSWRQLAVKAWREARASLEGGGEDAAGAQAAADFAEPRPIFDAAPVKAEPAAPAGARASRPTPEDFTGSGGERQSAPARPVPVQPDAAGGGTALEILAARALERRTGFTALNGSEHIEDMELSTRPGSANSAKPGERGEMPGGQGGPAAFFRRLFSRPAARPVPPLRLADEAGKPTGQAAPPTVDWRYAPAAPGRENRPPAGPGGIAGPGATDEKSGQTRRAAAGDQPPWLADLENGRIGASQLKPAASFAQAGQPERPEQTPPPAPARPPAQPQPPARSGAASAAPPAAGQLIYRNGVFISAAAPAAAKAATTRDGAPAAGNGPGSAARPKRIPPKLPPLDLLRPMGEKNSSISRDELEIKGRALMTCLANFSIQAELVRISPGPVVTSFEVRPAPGVKSSRITSLSDDIALSLKSISVRVQAPIPGTDTVGIEIPNDRRELVGLRELMASPAFQPAAPPGSAARAPLLNMALGKDISGRPVIADLARMPHMLVAGATGTGKSVFLNSVLLSFLYRARPDELKLLIIDPKRIEMAVYADLPHLVHPIVVETALAKNALDWAVAEMERRYNDIARLSVRNMAAYNQKLADYGSSRPPEYDDLRPMPYLVLVIDELADLMLTAGKDIETSIVRLAQLARAAGIHLIIATQRPSVDVVTGLIKANFPCRVSFQVTSKVDSRTILDGMGAEQLLGKGDMLFKPAGGQLQRLHGAFVPDEDVGAVADYWRAQSPPDYQVDFSDWGVEAGTEEGGIGPGGLDEDVSRDPVYAKIADFVLQEDSPSISKIQRYFRIGYNRAARYWDQLKKDGIVGPDNKVRM